METTAPRQTETGTTFAYLIRSPARGVEGTRNPANEPTICHSHERKDYVMTFSKYSVPAAVNVLLLLLPSYLHADDPAPARKNAPKTSIRVSKLIGMSVVNSADKTIGTVKDIVIDSEAGKVRYAAVSYRGFKGVDDKLFAVPWEDFTYRVDKKGKSTLHFDVVEDELKDAEAFDETEWPDFADHTFTDKVDSFYRIRRTRRGNRKVGVTVDREGVDVEIDKK